jgi:hypothetical protein
MTEDRLRSSSKAVIDRVALELERQDRLAEFAPAVGTGYHRVALAALQEGHPELAAECQALGARLGGETNVSRTALGRGLTRLIGFERKERLVQWLARRGIASGERRQSLRRRELHAGQRTEERGR